MKRNVLISILFGSLLLAGCNKPAGELVGVGNRGNFREANPYGMVFIKGGSFLMGANDQSAIGAINDKSIHVTVDAFWMDQTEITNDEYKQFVNWVRDSIILRSLVMAGRDEFRLKLRNQDELPPETAPLNWKAKIPWKSQDEEIREVLNTFYYEDVNSLSGRQLNPTKFRYRYEWINYDQAALATNKYDVNTGAYPKNAKVRVDTSYVDENGVIHHQTIERPLRTRKDLISTKIVNIYPDTIMWIRDFQYAYNEPKMKMYFSHPGFANYPVVGVTWEQAQAFCQWRTHIYNGTNKISAQDYRLPTEAEWEYAARGGNKSQGFIYAGSDKLKEVAWHNENSGNKTHPVGQKKPNELGLYDMYGNVYEWTTKKSGEGRLKGCSWETEARYFKSKNSSYKEYGRIWTCKNDDGLRLVHPLV